ncbi:cellulase family glycosylhydrolase [Paractinoplanes brasiliensis]|uniref:Endoglucanase n=1 Tax=Paractinoplanes brasiliensis TaxID=52695 RepID=A0A4R6JSE8_9ACTN|nr:cellulase family glycosylhydrolase [Actinoplanes brasiliensis]TDO38662.1 endoglucanase [Actinoplanes brasiliensis]GID26560.1 endoglucanase [Actinoplanes brasiliensis]
MRRWRILAGVAVAAVAATAATAIALPAGAETAVFTVASSWSNGYQGQVEVRNNTSSTISTWRVQLTLPAGTTVVNSWNTTQSASGSTYTFTPAGWNATLAAGASTSFGFIAGGAGRPTSCTVNGVSCDGSTTPPTSAPPTTPPTSAPPTGTTPVAINGQLRVCGTKLCNSNGKAIQLRGMSTHGLQWFAKCYNKNSLDALANDWKADLLRISMYVQEGGYETNPAGFTSQVNGLVDQAESRGLYALIDFHTLTPGDPNYNLARAKTFFNEVSARNANKKNVIYEITNEPNGVSWAGIKSYAEQVIPVIRANDPDAVIIVGTRGWSSLGVSEGGNSSEITANPVNASNIMYAFHFYAASHLDNYRAEVQRAAASLPLFVTEFGTVTYTGGGQVDLQSTGTWLDLLDRLQISYANWTYSDADESSAAFRSGTCNGSDYSSGVLSESGTYLKSRISTPDNF